MPAKHLIALLCSILVACSPASQKSTDKNDIRQHLNELHTKRFSLLFWYTDNSGKEQAAAAAGKAIYSKQDNTIAIYKDSVDKPIAVLTEEDFDQIKPVEESLKKMLLDAEYVMEFNVKDIPPDADSSQFNSLGFQVPVD
jgi:hypothetical protein